MDPALEYYSSDFVCYICSNVVLGAFDRSGTNRMIRHGYVPLRAIRYIWRLFLEIFTSTLAGLGVHVTVGEMTRDRLPVATRVPAIWLLRDHIKGIYRRAFSVRFVK